MISYGPICRIFEVLAQTLWAWGISQTLRFLDAAEAFLFQAQAPQTLDVSGFTDEPVWPVRLNQSQNIGAAANSTTLIQMPVTGTVTAIIWTLVGVKVAAGASFFYAYVSTTESNAQILQGNILSTQILSKAVCMPHDFNFVTAFEYGMNFVDPVDFPVNAGQKLALTMFTGANITGYCELGINLLPYHVVA